MKEVIVRVPATTANLGPGFDSFGCALNLYTQVSFRKKEDGLLITGCDEAFCGPDNLAYTAYCAAMAAMHEEIGGIHIHIEANIPISRGLGSSAALLAAGAMGANALHGNKLSMQQLLSITNALEGHPDNLAPALFGGLTASMLADNTPVCANFPLHEGWKFLAMVPDFPLSTSLARKALPDRYDRGDAVYNISHSALVLKALEIGDEKLLGLALQDKIHQPYRSVLIRDHCQIEGLMASLGAAFCISGAGPTLLCITQQADLEDKIRKGLQAITASAWTLYPLQAEHCGAHVIYAN